MSQESPSLVVKVFRDEQLVHTTDLISRLEVGRQRQGEPAPYKVVSTPHGPRLIVEKLTQGNVSRRHFLMEVEPDCRVKTTNLSSQLPVFFSAQDKTGRETSVNIKSLPAGTMASIAPGNEICLSPPFLLVLDTVAIRVTRSQVGTDILVGLDSPTMMPQTLSAADAEFLTLFASSGEATDRDSVLTWLQSIMTVFQQSASSEAFLPQAATAVVETVGLDVAAIVTCRDDQWKIEAIASSDDASEASWRPSTTILNRVTAEKRTFRQIPVLSGDSGASLMNVSALVAAPILSAEGVVIGAVYGDRRQRSPIEHDVEISDLEAKLVELLACGVAAGLARLEQEKAALAARVQFEQFFSPELSRQLQVDPGLLDGRDAEVTVLFADITGFSRISERMGPGRTVAWINDVLGTMSECVTDELGVLVDYVGDELMAMWGAPRSSDDHAARACRTALAMQERLHEVNARWQVETGEPIGFGIGINTGVARVGNVGSHKKFKYGPLGNTVNLASRIQGATKHLRSSLLISGSTAAQLDGEFAKRRLGKIKVVNIREPIDVFELVLQADSAWCELRDQYESALVAFEAADFPTAAKLLGSLVTSYPHDDPSILLLSRTVNCLVLDDKESFSPVWELGGK